ncbi:type II toxin-antitoxin system RelE/ParE family toxin [Ktedonosporobacter rubrisoli]|uniref:Type II toxin-antitoxin system RelE/ParE family toxin n=1 Tax=Ktedonosporobacter rubrisoli TaxID=2509675 RepID=A0A4P6JJG0_KTERU|nr:type II toxin-antitoxin system RelE/ParE family toxin [Ktedonosporobacter rubrisoli]QBD75173.1 type II toxin-antitoxin system RelE/ParE family toxin [Ktedonosporobacter rubrisoli]
MFCIFTAQAETDLESIADYIALDNPARALSFVQEIRERCRHIAHAPRGYPLAPEYGEDIRKLPFGNYLILYTLQADDIVILHIPHSARDLPVHS